MGSVTKVLGPKMRVAIDEAHCVLQWIVQLYFYFQVDGEQISILPIPQA